MKIIASFQAFKFMLCQVTIIESLQTPYKLLKILYRDEVTTRILSNFLLFYKICDMGMGSISPWRLKVNPEVVFAMELVRVIRYGRGFV